MTCRILKLQHQYVHRFRKRLLCRGLRWELEIKGTSRLTVKDCPTKRTGTQYIDYIPAGKLFRITPLLFVFLIAYYWLGWNRMIGLCCILGWAGGIWETPTKLNFKLEEWKENIEIGLKWRGCEGVAFMTETESVLFAVWTENLNMIWLP